MADWHLVDGSNPLHPIVVDLDLWRNEVSKHLFSPAGGELHKAQGNTRIEMIPFLVMRTAFLFSDLLEIRPDDREFSYCIQFSPDYKDTVESMLRDIEREGLPHGVTFYEVDGRRIFDMRGASGGVVYALCFYLITKGAR